MRSANFREMSSSRDGMCNPPFRISFIVRDLIALLVRQVQQETIPPSKSACGNVLDLKPGAAKKRERG